MAKEDIHVYSVDECFMDVTRYLSLYHLTAKEMAQKLMDAVMEETGITATAGIGTNLYLAKIAMDIVAKHREDHIGMLDEISYREQLWGHKPLSDFWRIGSRTERKLAGYGIQTMGDIALASIQSEDWLYKMFGIDAELLIDHAWGSWMIPPLWESMCGDVWIYARLKGEPRLTAASLSRFIRRGKSCPLRGASRTPPPTFHVVNLPPICRGRI